MANNPSRRIAPNLLQSDRESFAALQAVGGYAPANASYTVAAITAKQQAMEARQAAEAQAAAAAAAARDEATAAEWEFHYAILGAKEQIVAQFGKDSNEVQAVGLKRKSEYKRTAPRKQGGATK